MSKLFRIAPNKSGKVRVNLCMEDIYVDQFDTMVEFGLIKTEYFREESFTLLKEAIPVPKFNKFYASRIKSTRDPYLNEVITLLLYLNPMPDLLLRKKLVEFIIMRFSKMEMRPSQVKSTELTATPVLNFRDVESALNMCIVMGIDEPLITTGVYVLFSRESMYSRETKMRIHSEIRELKVKNHLASAIHIVAEHLMDSFDKVKITTSKIENTKMVTTKKGPASIRSISKYMSEATKRDISDHNVGAEFKSYRAFEKYERFLEIEGGSLDRTAKELGVSKSTVIEFKRIQNER